MSLTSAELKEQLTALRKECEIHYTPGGRYIKKIDQLITMLDNGGTSKLILAELGVLFQEGVRQSNHKYSPSPTENFIIMELNPKPSEYTFYRGIGLILKAENQEDTYNIYNSIQSKEKKLEVKDENIAKKTAAASAPENIGNLNKDQLLLLLGNLKWQCEESQRKKLFSTQGQKKLHENHIDQLNLWINNLKSGDENEQSTISDLKEWFRDAAELRWKDPERFIADLNTKPNDHLFYRGIGLILRENDKNTKEPSLYKSVLEIAEIKEETPKRSFKR